MHIFLQVRMLEYNGITWRPTDDVWSEHALWFPYCIYVRYIK